MIGAEAYIGKLIGNYRVDAEISNNGLSCVYRGEQSSPTERVVAIKLWYTIHLPPLKQLQFLQEVRVLKMLKHPHLLPILDSGIYEDSPYLVTEYISNGSLRDRIGDEPAHRMPIQEILTILSQVGQALQYAHHFNITHGNLKPENILFSEERHALLSDFVVSTLTEAASNVHVNDIRAASYMAPEQFQGVTGEASDQYALGCIAYELLTGRVPFIGVDSSALGLKHAQESPLPPTLFNMLLPAHMEEAILKVLSKEQEDRYASVKHFLTALGTPSLFQPRMLPVPVTPTLPALYSSRSLAQPTSTINLLQPDKQQHGNKDDSPGSAEIWQYSDLDETPKSIEEEDTAAILPIEEALLPQDMSREQDSPPNDAPAYSKVVLGTLTHVGIKEKRHPVTGRNISGSRSSRLLWFTMFISSVAIVATIISVVFLALLAVPSPRTTLQVIPQTPTRKPSSKPSPMPSVAPSSTPTHQTAPVPSLQPSPTPSPTPSPSPTPVPGLIVTPGQFNAQSDCSFQKHSYICYAILALPQSAGGNISWSASSSGLNQVSFSPSAGVLSPGQQQQVVIYVRSNCPITGSLIFSGGNTVTVMWSC